MIDIYNKNHCPCIEEVKEYVGNEAFNSLCEEMTKRYNCVAKIEYSTCSMASGWNVKYKASGKSLCTLYPKQNFFTVLVVVGRKEKEALEAILPECSIELQQAYYGTRECNAQRWLMLDVEDMDKLFEDILKLIQIRRDCK